MGIVVLILIYILNSKKSFYFFNCEVSDFKTLSISSARDLLKQCKEDFKLPSHFKSEEFRMVANGFFQAEGHISCLLEVNIFHPYL